MNFLPRGTKSSEKMRLPTERERETEVNKEGEREREHAGSIQFLCYIYPKDPTGQPLSSQWLRETSP